MRYATRAGHFTVALVAFNVAACLSRTDWVVAELGSPWPAGWFEMGGSGSGGGVSDTAGVHGPLTLAIDGRDRPVVAWRDSSSGSTEIYLRRWDGVTWGEIGGSGSDGGISANGDISEYPSVAVGVDDAPVVAWQDSSTGFLRVFLRRWNGSAWQELGSSVTSGVGSSSALALQPQVAVDNDDRPIVAWQDFRGGASSNEIYLARWSGGTWEGLGGSDAVGGLSNTSGDSQHCSLALDEVGAPVVAWAEGAASSPSVYVRRWSGSAWTEQGGSASGAGLASGRNPSIATAPDGGIWVAWDGTSGVCVGVCVAHWDGTDWGTLITVDAEGGVPSLALDSSGRPVVTYLAVEAIGSAAVRLRRWSGSTWADLDGSGSAGGISGMGPLSAPRLAVRGSLVCVAWSNSTDVFVRCHRLP